jgi:Protein of unknown function (DUF1592)/Protein of unknown function (DUF1588)/Protein of unknown function (DUF1587)/Protein of unknown function (DUF1585)/Protein of unknown function (DUF1595)/Planctomycete cytochrome C
MAARLATVFLLFQAMIASPAFALLDGPQASDEASKEFEAATLPLVKRYCLECHSTEEQEGDLDLERFVRLDQVQNAPRVWQRVGELLNSGEMPPKEARQPDDAERARLRRWVGGFLATEAIRRAGDPGRVVLRRLNNAEYTYTLRDLTGVDSLEPAREFPVDGAAGEGFTNTGNALVMSPSLVTKYLDAAKGVASHAVLLPDGFRFSPGATRRDWSEENLAKIREFYREFTDPRAGGEKVNLQGIIFDTNKGGRLPVERYLAATIAERQALTSGAKSVEIVASERGLNAKYLGTLWRSLMSPSPSLILGGLQTRWKAAKPEDVPALVAEVTSWQKGFWKFSSVGHIGKVGGPKAWMEPVNPLIARQQIRFKVPPSADGKDVTLSLVATDAGDGDEHDFVVWRQPRLVAPGRPDLLLRDVRRVAQDLASKRDRLFADTAKYLDASAEAETEAVQGQVDAGALATRRGLDPDSLRAWLDYLGIVPGDVLKLTGHFTKQLKRGGAYDFINGWGRDETPLLLTNSSDQHVRIPGNMKPHSVAVHPSPTLQAAIGWQSPLTASMRIEGSVKHAHPECGNGVTWSLELRRGSTRRRLASGIAAGSKVQKVGPMEGVAIQVGDLVSVVIGPRDGNHSCDLTAIDLKLAEIGGPGQVWDLAADVSGDVLAGNPHADRLGHPEVWHFYTEPDKGASEGTPVIPDGSILARWQASKADDEKHRLAEEAERLLTSGESAPKDGPDATLRQQLRSVNGPLLGAILRARPGGGLPDGPANANESWGLDPSLFGKHPSGKAIDPANLCVRAPALISFRIPAELAEGAELVTSGVLDEETGAEGSVQLEVVAGQSPRGSGLKPAGVTVTVPDGSWTSGDRSTSYSSPIVVNEGSASRKRIEAALDDFRNLFPAALCYSKIVPVDEVVTLTLFHREDGHLARLMLDDSQKATLDRLWDELHFASQDALTLVDAFVQILEYASQDGDPRVFEPLRKPINDRATAFRRQLVEAEPRHLDALLEFAARAYRRPLTGSETDQFRQFYSGLRAQEIPHDEAFRLTLARVLVAPGFLYRTEKPGPGSGQGPVSNGELATRLSYFLWSSTPDRELRELAESGKLADPEILMAQTKRMLVDDKTRRLATEFACQWLHIAGFDQLDEKSERHFPTFLGLRAAMYEESVRFFTDFFRNDGSVLDILGADHTFLNAPLAEHYGIPLAKPARPEDWQRVDGIKRYGRGGILGQATTLATQSGASRTSPILRGNWISEVLLGERLPRPPKGVPQLPDDEAATAGLTVRQLVEKHANDAKCSVCHQRIDPLGFSLEGFDAIGRRRDKDLGDRPIDTRARAMDGAQFEGLDGLKDYLLTARREAFLKQFCRKLLGFALGRSTQLSDDTLLADMQAALKTNGYRVGSAIEVIVRSRQFREIRGRETAYTD